MKLDLLNFHFGFQLMAKTHRKMTRIFNLKTKKNTKLGILNNICRSIILKEAQFNFYFRHSFFYIIKFKSIARNCMLVGNAGTSPLHNERFISYCLLRFV